MSAFILKIIALLVMFADHIGVVFDPLTDVILLREIGRVAFPIFIFFIAEGCRHTRNIKLYMWRLGLFAMISEIPFDLASADFQGGAQAFNITALDFMAHQNVFFTFFLGVLCVYIYQTLSEGIDRLLCIVLIPAVIYLGDFLRADYGSVGVMFVFILYILPYTRKEGVQPPVMSGRSKFYRIAALFCLLFYLYIIERFNFHYARLLLNNNGLPALIEKAPNLLAPYSVSFLIYGCISLFLLSFYNGKRGRPLKWLFYAAYPAHLLMLGVVRFAYVIPEWLSYYYEHVL